MKLIEINQHYFTIKGESGRYFCTDAETDISLNPEGRGLTTTSPMPLPPPHRDKPSPQPRTLDGNVS